MVRLADRHPGSIPWVPLLSAPGTRERPVAAVSMAAILSAQDTPAKLACHSQYNMPRKRTWPRSPLDGWVVSRVGPSPQMSSLPSGSTSRVHSFLQPMCRPAWFPGRGTGHTISFCSHGLCDRTPEKNHPGQVCRSCWMMPRGNKPVHRLTNHARRDRRLSSTLPTANGLSPAGSDHRSGYYVCGAPAAGLLLAETRHALS